MSQQTAVKVIDITPTIPKFNREVNYRKCNSTFAVVRFITECCNKLGASCLIAATASTLFHKFVKNVKSKRFDPYTIAMGCIGIATKLYGNRSYRGVVTIGYHTVTGEVISLGSDYESLKRTVLKAELFILRVVNFEIAIGSAIVHPYSYLLSYLNVLRQYMGKSSFDRYPLAKVSWSLMQDFYHDPSIISIDGELLSLACIYIALQVYGVQLSNESDLSWMEACCPKATKESVLTVASKVLNIYQMEDHYLSFRSDEGNSSRHG